MRTICAGSGDCSPNPAGRRITGDRASALNSGDEGWCQFQHDKKLFPTAQCPKTAGNREKGGTKKNPLPSASTSMLQNDTIIYYRIDGCVVRSRISIVEYNGVQMESFDILLR